MEYQKVSDESLRSRMSEVFRLKWEDEQLPQYSELLEKFVFHMCDASGDLRAITGLLENSDDIDSCRILAKSLHRFFIHAIPHLVAAGQIYDYVPRLFAEQDGVHTLPTETDESCADDD